MPPENNPSTMPNTPMLDRAVRASRPIARGVGSDASWLEDSFGWRSKESNRFDDFMVVSCLFGFVVVCQDRESKRATARMMAS